jgi:hypothetical protein
MGGGHLDDAEHWRGRALQARANADLIADPDAQRKMLKIAADYDRLAERAEERRAKGSGPQQSGTSKADQPS